MSNAAITPLVLAPSSETAEAGSLDAALARLQSPPFETPVVLDLSGCTDVHRCQLTRVLDVMRWRTVWSPAVVVCPRSLRPLLAELRFSPAGAVHETVTAALPAGHPLAVRAR